MAASQLQGVILTAMHDAPVQPAQVQGVILTAMHDAPVQPAQVQGVILTAMHDAPVQVAQLQSVILTAMHDAGPTGFIGLVGQAQVDRLGLVGSSVRVKRPQE
jgi:hypothetical protein